MKQRFYVLFRGDVYATEFFDVNNMAELKAEARRFLGVSRLPRGTECWISGGVR